MGQDEQVPSDDADDVALSAEAMMSEDADPERDPEPTSAAEIRAVDIADDVDDLNAEGIAETSSVDPGPFEIEVEYRRIVLCAFAHTRTPTARSISIRNVGGDKPGELTVSVTSRRGVSDCRGEKPSETIVERQAAGQPVTIELPSYLLNDVTLGVLDEAAPATLRLALQTGEKASSLIERPVDVIAKRKIGQAIVDQVALIARAGSSPSARLGGAVRYIDGLGVEQRGPIELISSLGSDEGLLGGWAANALRPRAYV